ncbi:hypothetical protein SAMN04487983_1010170 [Streptomyces sp. yr375]|uniref:hypothetical protein n=1 Tax=Streptomyces sp. yr375 TaxID=1761906 RepID=UPI0008CC18DF|nr:hypothetical protein [Streptomyces sp. yr375]SER03493.1 hypothetical protein SAMN04487983_1010170 [Streptomyces sp. yr375]
MGIESDQVVYEYLSRVGDVAQQRQLSSATRMRLVSELRNEIDRRRAKATVDSPAAVRRIIDRLGSPDDLVDAAADSGTGAPQQPAPSVPVQRAVPQPGTGSVPLQKSGDRPKAADPDWWLRGPAPLELGDDVPGFVGGVEIPDLLKPPPPRTVEGKDAEGADAGDGADGDGDGDEDARPRRRRLLRLPFPRGSSDGPGRRWSNPLLLIAAGSLVAGAVLGNWFALIAGWAIAYVSRRLTERETKFAVIWLPGLSVAAGLVWLWGRSDGRWGEPIAAGHMNDALAGTWPWVIRGAAVASALFLVWRSQKQR